MLRMPPFRGLRVDFNTGTESFSTEPTVRCIREAPRCTLRHGTYPPYAGHRDRGGRTSLCHWKSPRQQPQEAGSRRALESHSAGRQTVSTRLYQIWVKSLVPANNGKSYGNAGWTLAGRWQALKKKM
jgi:hypothetical protein